MWGVIGTLWYDLLSLTKGWGTFKKGHLSSTRVRRFRNTAENNRGPSWCSAVSLLIMLVDFALETSFQNKQCD